MLINVLGTEILKMKRTLGLWLALIAPAVIVAANVGIYAQRGRIAAPEGTSVWVWYGQMNIVVWGLLMIPLFVTLETALVGNMEHASGHWTHLNALPVPRPLLYAGKLFAGMALIGLSCLSLVVTMVGGGKLLELVRPGIGLAGQPPWGPMLLYAGMIFLGSWLVTAIQTWISLRWKSFVVSSAVGIALTVAGVFVVNAEWGSFWPWAIPGAIANEFNEGVILVPELMVGALAGLAAGVLGGWDVSRRDVL
jgi:hypothetical protein